MDKETFNELKERVFNNITEEKIKEKKEEILEACEKLQQTKGEDYTKGDEDVLKNFKEAGDYLGIEPHKSLGLYMKKHFDAIFNYIKTGGQSQSEPIHGRIVDAINYLIFLEALFEEMNKE